MKNSVITGITGQDGAYLAQCLLEKGHVVYGAYRRTSSNNFWRIKALGIDEHPNLHLIEFELTDLGSAIRLLETSEADEVYNLAALSFVKASFDQPTATGMITGLGVLHLLEAIRIVNRNIRFYQASTSEMFGATREFPQTEDTPFHPRSPYGAAKLYAHWITINYRESFDIFGSTGILFNHESPLRGLEFVTRKITDAVARIHLGMQDHIELGNLNAKRDWGYAKDYVDGIRRIMQHDVADTFILATGRTESVRDFVRMAFQAVDIPLDFKGSDENEIGVNADTGKTLVSVNPKFYRPAEVDVLIGNPGKAERILGWKSETDLESLCRMMMEADVRRWSEKV